MRAGGGARRPLSPRRAPRGRRSWPRLRPPLPQVKAAAWASLALALSAASNWSRASEVTLLMYAAVFSVFSLVSVYAARFKEVRLLPPAPGAAA